MCCTTRAAIRRRADAAAAARRCITTCCRTPLLYATNYEGGKCSRYLFSFGAVPNQELGQLLPYLTQTFGNTYFLLGADRVWPHQMFDIAQPLIAKLGGRVVGTRYTLGTETDFSPLIKEVAASKAKVLLFALKGDGMDFIRQADEAGLLKEITVAFLGRSEVDLGIFRGKGQNMVTVVPAVAASEDPAVKAFVAKARAAANPGVAVSNYVMTHYNTLIDSRRQPRRPASSTRRPSSTRWRGSPLRRRPGR
ncbi:ABC transporter substrate-binding protein [Bradyrhizobium sp. Pear77]|uniref:ABC transporter substrate-binding protein n=1 Tax=Bradyrhizobium altum TaxID=1571202 RepID=UPI0035DCB77A|nr:ABC transporter substrate-binding protein [Bradyrhizobium altum]